MTATQYPKTVLAHPSFNEFELLVQMKSPLGSLKRVIFSNKLGSLLLRP